MTGRLYEWIEQSDGADVARRSHVFRVEFGDARGLARAEQHAVPVREAELGAKIEGVIDHIRSGKPKGNMLRQEAK